METFTVHRVFSDANGDSHFEEVKVPLEPSGEIGFLSGRIPVKEVIFRTVLPSYDYDFHNAPDRQYIVLLDGRIEIETSLGEKKEFGAGEVLLVEDVTGKGHRTRNLINQPRRSIFVTLPG